MPRRFSKLDLSNSAAIERLLDLGITETKEIIFVCACYRARAWDQLLLYFQRRGVRWPALFAADAEPSPELVRSVRAKWRKCHRPIRRRKAGLTPLAPKKKPGRKGTNKSALIREMLLAGKSTEAIKAKLHVTANLVRQVRHALNKQ